MGNAALEKKPKASKTSILAPSTTTPRAPTTPTGPSIFSDNNNVFTSAIVEEESSDSSSDSYNFENPQSVVPSNPDAKYSLLDLPNEILCLLIANLEAKNDIRSLMFASKVFVDLVYYSWSRLSLQYDNKLTYHQFLELPAERLNYLLELDISYCSKMTNALFNQILDKTPNLQVLKMKGCKRLTRAAFNKLARSFTKFTAIDLRECNMAEISVADFPQCPNLKELAIGIQTFSIFESKVDPLAITCLNLKTVATFGSINPSDLNKFVNLVTFKGGLPDSRADFSALKELENLTLTKEVLSIKFGAPQKIKRLNISAVNTFDTNTLVDLTNLVSLKLRTGYIANFTTLWFPKLEELEAHFEVDAQELIQRKAFVKLDVLFKTTEDAIAVILANPNLKYFKFHAVLLHEVFNALRSLKKLEELEVSYISMAKPLKWKRLKALKSLSIVNASYKDVDSLRRFKQIPKLEKLFLCSSDGIRYSANSDAVLRKFCEQFEGFPKLRVLKLRDSTYHYPEREEMLMRIKGLIYVEWY